MTVTSIEPYSITTPHNSTAENSTLPPLRGSSPLHSSGALDRLTRAHVLFTRREAHGLWRGRSRGTGGRGLPAAGSPGM
jgi:hypothetical protein